jgi:methionyl-tRNA synthetase
MKSVSLVPPFVKSWRLQIVPINILMRKTVGTGKKEGQEQQVHDVCSVGINLFRQLAIYLAPVLPTLATQVQAFLQLESFDFASRKQI